MPATSHLAIKFDANLFIMANRKNKKSALHVNQGIEQPSALNNELIKNLPARKRTIMPLAYYIDGITQGNITPLSQAITIVESTLPAHYDLAQQIIEHCLPLSGNSIRIGITGVPGVGKSTFIEAIGQHITTSKKKLAVLAVDPSSERSKGSILGDKTRMEELSSNPLCFIRPSPSGGNLGGVARKTRETIILCEAAGYEVILIETVGVGQSETTVKAMVDFFLLLMLAGAGDELQGIKRGIMEMADMIVINKADGDNIIKAQLAKTEYTNALHLFPPTDSAWKPIVNTCSSISKNGINEIWEIILNYKQFTQHNNFFWQNRNAQLKNCITEAINQTILNNFYYNNSNVAELLEKYKKMVVNGKISPYIAAQKIIEHFS